MNFGDSCSYIIDINGLGCPKDTSVFLQKYPYWTQIHIPQILYIPDEKPASEEINSVNININILRKKVIKTPISIENLDGKVSTGRKLIVEGQIYKKIIYTALNEVQSIHSVNFYFPFYGYITIPKSINFNGDDIDSLDISYQVDACVEDLSINKIGEKCLLNNVTLLLSAIPIQ